MKDLEGGVSRKPVRVRAADQVHCGRFHTIEEWAARLAYRGYELSGHGSQSFERLQERGGFSLEELVHFAYVAGTKRRGPIRMGGSYE